MRRGARLARWFAGCALLLAGGAGAQAGPPAPTEASFVAALEKARSLLAAGDAVTGQRVLDDALAAHAKQDYVRAKRLDLEDLVRRLAFRAECPPPDPATLVEGTLKKYVSKTGDLELRYSAGKPTDFTKDKDGDLVFPARFCGPFTVSMRGDSYPKTTKDSPEMQVGLEDDPKTGRSQVWRALAGIPPYDEGNETVWLPAKLIYYDGDDKKVVAEKETSLAKPGQPWKLEMSVGRSKVVATFNGKPIGTAPKTDAVFGRVILSVKDWAEIVVEGRVEPSWIQSKVDAVVEKKRAAFEADFSARKRLPDWLYETAAAPEAPAEAPSGFGEVPPAVRLDLVRVVALIAKDDFATALSALEALRAGGAPEALVSMLEARAHLGLDEPTSALSDVDRAIAAAPGRLDLLTLRAEILDALGREDEMVAAWKAAIQRPEAGAEVFVAACLSLLYAGQQDASRAVAEEAVRRGRRSPALDVVGRVLVQSANGPAWPKTYEFKSTNYDVSSDIDLDTCRQAAQVLEEALAIYRSQVHSLKPEKARLYRVFLFSGKAGFQRYLADVTALSRRKPENVAGLYSGLLKQLLIWNLESREEMMQTIRHEGFHQYLDRLMPDPPVWFNEGMATYFEGMERVGGALNTGKPRAEDLALLAESPMTPAASFLRISAKDFYAGGQKSYAQAWLLVHLMKHGPNRYRDLYKTLMARLETAGGAETVQAVFDEKALSTLDADLQAYRESLAKRR